MYIFNLNPHLNSSFNMLIQFILYTTGDTEEENHQLKQNHNKITVTCKDDVWMMQDIHGDNLLFAYSTSHKNLMTPKEGFDIMYLPSREMLETYCFSLWWHPTVLFMLHSNEFIYKNLLMKSSI